jgi:hypothetical protein
MFGGGLQHVGIGFLHLAQQRGLDLILDEAYRPTRMQTDRGRPQHRHQERASGGAAEPFVEPGTEVHVKRGGAFDRGIDQRHVADFQKRAVADVVVGGPLQQVDRVRLADQPGQPLAGAIPVDQKDEARSDECQEALEVVGRSGGVTATGRFVLDPGR